MLSTKLTGAIEGCEQLNWASFRDRTDYEKDCCEKHHHDTSDIVLVWLSRSLVARGWLFRDVRLMRGYGPRLRVSAREPFCKGERRG